jgi:substrate import-associated zinc metallohydrolase lipoprotein
MKKEFIVLFLGILLAVGITVSCSKDELGPTIFDTVERPLDRKTFTFPLDTFCKVNFLEPYNMRYIYKLEDIGSDLQKNLIPASYMQSKKLAVLTKYLWYEVYEKLAGETFLKLYSPRIILLTGSPSVNASSHTETLGTAEGGLKVYLYKVNTLDENVIEGHEGMNYLFFHTMHHEFAHILDQTRSRPTDFDLLSNGKYDVQSWGEADDSLRAGQGFVSPYASSQAREDWVEVLSGYVCNDTLQWEELMNNAKYEWEEMDIAKSQADSINRLRQNSTIPDSIGHVKIISENAGTYKLVRKLVARNADGSVAKKADGTLDYLEKDGINGYDLIQEKLKYVRDWLDKEYGINLDKMRREVQSRTYVMNADGTFPLSPEGKLINRIVQPIQNDTITLMDSLLYQIDRFEPLIEK